MVVQQITIAYGRFCFHWTRSIIFNVRYVNQTKIKQLIDKHSNHSKKMDLICLFFWLCFLRSSGIHSDLTYASRKIISTARYYGSKNSALTETFHSGEIAMTRELKLNWTIKHKPLWCGVFIKRFNQLSEQNFRRNLLFKLLSVHRTLLQHFLSQNLIQRLQKLLS